MKPIVKPRLGLSASSSELDRLSEHRLSHVQTAAQDFIRAFSPPREAPHLATCLAALLIGLRELAVNIDYDGTVIEEVMESVEDLQEALADEGTIGSRVYIDERAHADKYPVYSTLRSVRHEDVDRLRAIALAFVISKLTQSQVNSSYARKILNDKRAPVMEGAFGSHRPWYRDYLKLERELKSLLGHEIPDDFQSTAAGWFVFSSKNADPKLRDGIVDRRALTLGAFADVCRHIAHGIRTSDKLSIAVAAGWLSGLPWRLAQRIPLCRPDSHDDEWVIWLDVDNACFHRNLSPIVRNAAVARGNEGYVHAVKHYSTSLPSELAETLKILKDEVLGAQSLGELTQTLRISARDSLRSEAQAACSESIARFYRSRSAVTAYWDLSALEAAMALGCFDRITHSRLYYITRNQEQIHKASARIFQGLDWGAPAASANNNKAVGSEVVPTDEMVRSISERLATAVEASIPPRRWSKKSIIRFHNCFARYTTFVLSLSTLARARNRLAITGISLGASVGFTTSDDKVKSRSSLSLVALARLAREQLEFWCEHLRCLRRRALALGDDVDALIRRIDNDLKPNSDSSIFTLNEELQPLDVGTIQTFRDGDGIEIKGDLARHFAEVVFADSGLSDVHAEAQARRKRYGGLNETQNSTQNFLDSYEQICRALDARFDALGLRSMPGLKK